MCSCPTQLYVSCEVLNLLPALQMYYPERLAALFPRLCITARDGTSAAPYWAALSWETLCHCCVNLKFVLQMIIILVVCQDFIAFSALMKSHDFSLG